MSNIRLFYPENIIDKAESSTKVFILEVMGRHAGWMAASSALARNDNSSSPHIILLPEIIFEEKKFLNKVKEPGSSKNLELAICLVKKNPMETILQKDTELGVSKITPIISERTEVKELNYERAKKIVVEATEQSNQLSPPEISNVIKLKDFLNNLDSSTKLLFADVNSKDNLKKETSIEVKSFSVLIGPEGDFSPSERELILQTSNIIPFTLSKNILRSDTAVISAISLVNFINNIH